MTRGKKKNTDEYRPNGSIIYWSRRQRIGTQYWIPVKCGRCGQERVINSSGIYDNFTGLCQECGHIERRKVNESAPQTLPNGSVILWNEEFSRDGIRWVPIRCGGPFCNGSVRHVPVYTTYTDNFTGECRRCSHGYDRSGRWSGGRKKSRPGYILVRLPPNHRFYCMVNSDGNVLEHRLVMAEQIGRPLTTEEIVHHINGIKDDNRPENLELLIRDQYHAGYHSHPDNHRNTVLSRLKAVLIRLLQD